MKSIQTDIASIVQRSIRASVLGIGVILFIVFFAKSASLANDTSHLEGRPVNWLYAKKQPQGMQMSVPGVPPMRSQDSTAGPTGQSARSASSPDETAQSVKAERASLPEHARTNPKSRQTAKPASKPTGNERAAEAIPSRGPNKP